ncbi:MAG: 3'(2'),5'-bisphosphate nucleotidase CysQ [Myxococcota bacterium]
MVPPSATQPQDLAVAIDLARQAGAIVLKHYAADFTVQYKDAAGSDPVTQADKDANDVIVRGLRQAFPKDGILAEESTDSAARLACDRLWCIDPLDGTREFVERNGQFVVMIGLAIAGEAHLGVVYQPTEDILWWGANGQAKQVDAAGKVTSLAPSLCHDASKARMMVSRSHRSQSVSAVATELGISQQRPMGSVGLKVAQIALSLAEIYLSVTDRTKEWDACAPEAILRAAGGTMTDILGQPLRYNKTKPNTPRGMLASNGVFHTRCIEALKPLVKSKGWES